MDSGWRVLEEKRFVIPFIPPSVNTIYQIIFSQRRVEMKPEVRLWKTKAKEYIPNLTPFEDSHLFSIDVKYYYDWYYKNGRFKKFDTANLLKILIDAIAEKCGFDDSRVKVGSWESYHTTSERVEVVVKQIMFNQN
jgi:Holliday junction resolvase RusA-like endonuclease